MKKGSFDLTGKAIDCRELPSMGDAGREIFRALKVACNGDDNPEYAKFKSIKNWGFLSRAKIDFNYILCMNRITDVIIQPIDVLGQDRIDAAIDGATLVFEGDVVPKHSSGIFYGNGTKTQGRDTREYTLGTKHIIIAHKALEEKHPSIQSRVLSEKIGAKHDSGKPLYNLIPVHAEAEFVDVLTFGATKYSPN